MKPAERILFVIMAGGFVLSIVLACLVFVWLACAAFGV